MRTPWVVLLLAANVVTKSDDEWMTNYEHVGAWVGSSLESSPIFFQGKLYLMQSQMGPFPRDGSNGSHSFFCVMDGRTGEEVSCPPSSSGHAFCSSIVDHTGPTERAWVFCSAWDRANQTSCRDPLWGCGACGLSRSNESDCYVAAWSSTDLRSWTSSAILTLPRPLTVPNVAVSMIPPSSRDRPLPSGLPSHQAWMALDAPAPPIAVNTASGGDLHNGWEFVDRNYTDANDNNNRWGGMGVECMAVRYNPMDDYYYAFGGGEEIDLTRSRNLSVGSWERGPPTAPRGHLKGRGILMATGCAWGNESCVPTAGMSRIAEGYYTNYWKNYSDNNGRDRAFLKNLTRWNWSVNDADFCDENGAGPTRFIYGMSCQTRPAANASDGGCGNFYSLGVYPGNESEWLSSYFEPPPPPPAAAASGSRDTMPLKADDDEGQGQQPQRRRRRAASSLDSLSFCEQPGWSTTFVDEFDGPSLNTTNWHAVDETTADHAWCLSKVATQSPNNKNWLRKCTRSGTDYPTYSKAEQVSVEGGALVIRADAARDNSTTSANSSQRFINITTGGVTSKHSFGGSRSRTRICLNAMLPGGGAKGTGQGFWPALWMMPDDSSCWACHGEIDIVEQINGAGSVQSHYHYSTNTTWCAENERLGCTLKPTGDCTAGGCGPAARGAYGTVPNFGSAYHEYAVEFDGASQVAFAYDGRVIGNITRDSRGHGAKPFFSDVAFYLIMDFMIGEAGSWSGPPDVATVFPAFLRLDSVRVAQQQAEERRESHNE